MPTQNRLVQSEDFSTTWNVVGYPLTVATNTADTTDPWGTNKADKLTASGGLNYHLAYQSLGVQRAAGKVVTASFFVKAGTTPHIMVGSALGSAWHRAWFSLTGAGVKGSAPENIVRSDIVALANGWYRVSVTWVQESAGGTTDAFIGPTPALGTTGTWSPGGTPESIYAIGAQMEDANAMGEYVATLAAAVDNGAPPNKRLGQNLIRYSEDFTNAVYTTSGDPVPTNIVSPLGTTTKGSLMDATGNFYHDRYLSAPFTGAPLIVGATYCLSVYLKSLGRNANLYVSDGVPSKPRATFDLTAGTVTFTGGTNFRDAKIVPVKDSTGALGTWFRAWVTHVCTGTLDYLELIKVSGTGDIAPYVGDVTKGIGAFGLQYEIGDAPGDYIATTSVVMP